MKASLPLLLASASLSVLGACATAPPEGPPSASVADRHRIRVEQTGERLELPVSAEAISLSREEQQQVGVFASAYVRMGHGSLIMSSPSGGANANAAALVAHQTRLALVDAGVPYQAIAGSSYDASGAADAPIILSFTRYEAFAPECAPLWEQDLAHQLDNQPWESFGCATQANLAAMIEDPRDLLGPRGEDPRDSGRRGTVFEAYRAGESTGAERSSDERVSVSNAVQ